MKVAIYIDYYSHENSICYKIDLSWTGFQRDTVVLCPITKGYELAKLIAVGVINKHLVAAIDVPDPAQQKKEESQYEK